MPLAFEDFFRVEKEDLASKARAGLLKTAHGLVPTPAFMPVGTRGSVKAMGPDDLVATGAHIVLANAYHLLQRPGLPTIRLFGGLHKFMGWPGPILTDSGGYQVFSLSALRKIEPAGVTFRSPYDGSLTFFSPETALETQMALGSDLMACLDECAPYPATFEATEKSLALTLSWAQRSRAAWEPEGGGAPSGEPPLGQAPFRQALFGVVQGGFYPELRRRAAQEIAALDFPFHALGGLALGEPFEERLMAIETARAELPAAKPLYLMGLGTPEDLIEGILRGADLFDCVMPTRNARNGQLFVPGGRLNLLNARYREDQAPPDPNCQCLACRTFSRAYLRHLLKNREPLFPRLATIHNLAYYHGLLAGARRAILAGRLKEYVQDFYAQRAVSPLEDSPA